MTKSMSNWDNYSIEDKVRAILTDVEYYKPDHHFGHPYLTAYQLAIAFSKRYPQDFNSLGLQIGGKNCGEQFSLSQYLAGELSRRIKSNEIADIEGSFISNLHLDNIILNNNGAKIESSLTNTNMDLSMFRLK